MKKRLAALGLVILSLSLGWFALRVRETAPPDAAPANTAGAAIPPVAGAAPVIPAATTGAPPRTVPVARPRSYAFGQDGPVALSAIPEGEFRRQLTALQPDAQAHALKEMERLQIPFIDLGSLRVDANGQLFYVCDLPGKDEKEAKGVASDPAQRPTPGVGVDGPELGSTRPATAADFAVAVPVSSPPIRHSKPGASKVIYLDFNGHTVTGTAWNTAAGAPAAYVCLPFDRDGNASTFSPAEQAIIVNIWERVAEDYRAFDVNVTTEEPAVFTDTTARALITADKDANGVANPSSSSAAGVAYVGVFGKSTYRDTYAVSFIYHTGLSEGYLAVVVSHELGHNMGLSHDGTLNSDGSKRDEYYSGHGSGATGWSPLMGSGSRMVQQWSRGEYYQASNLQDDLGILTALLGARPDDHLDTIAGATPLFINGAEVRQRGTISSAADADRFSFKTSGAVSLTVAPHSSAFTSNRGSLDVVAEIYNAAGSLVTSVNPADATDATISTTLAAGTYTLRISGTGTGSPLSSTPTGYTSYASIGQYQISGTIAPSADLLAAGIAEQPESQSVFPGNTARFSVIAVGNPAVSYQWQRSTDNGSSWQNLASDATHSGMATAALAVADLSAPMNGYRYRCVVTNSVASATSTAATLTIQTPPPPVLPVFGGTGVPVPSFSRGLPASTSQNLSITLQAGTEPITYQWRLNGVDIPGANGLYYFVRNWQPVHAGVYTIVATNSVGSVTSGPYTQYISPEGGWRFRNPLVTGNGLTRAAFINGRFLVGGLRGTLLVSTDGLNWTTRTVPASNNLYGFHYVNGLYVALGSLGAIFTSTDTITWTPRNTGTLHQDGSSGLQFVAYSGERLMAVGTGGTVTTSTDGITWTAGTVGTGDDLNGVAFAFGKFHAVSQTSGRVYSSSDGTTWTSVASSSNTLRAIVFGAGRLVSGGTGGVMSTSTDGLNWSSVSTGSSNTIIGLDYVNNFFYAACTGGVLLRSSNGTSWTVIDIATNNSNLQSVAYGNGLYVVPGQSGVTGRALLTSTDGLNWTQRITGVGAISSNLRAITAGDSGLVAAGTAGVLLYSTNGTTWTQDANFGLLFNDVAYGNGLYVATGNNGSIAGAVIHSATGAPNTWISQPGLTGVAALNGVRYHNGAWVLVGLGGTTQRGRVYTSTTGTAWTLRYTSGTALNKSSYGNGVSVAVGDAGAVARSTDGTNWTGLLPPTTKNLRDIAFGAGLHVAVGEGIVLSSPDGNTWTDRTFTPDTLTSVIYAAGHFIATGPASTYYVSSDGLNWTGRFTGAFDPVFDTVVFNNTIYAVGDNSIIIAANTPVIDNSAALTVNAGTPLTLRAAVAASATPVTYQWFRDGAPVGGATSPITTLHNPFAGSYTLVATNGFGETTSAPTVLTLNKIAQTITFPAPANRLFTTTPFSLIGSASSGLALSYTVLSGPATLNGDSLTLTGTGTVTVRASQAGDSTYEPAAPVDRSFTVAPSFASWQRVYFTAPELANSALSGPNASYATDGLPNLVKYALGLNPTQSSSLAAVSEVTASISEWIFTYTRPEAVTDLTYTVEYSLDLVNWSSVGVIQELVLRTGGQETWRGFVPRGVGANVYFRLRVTRL
ncbi:MAG: M12 family metallo-peptidase [Candidatus Didemnitutus sp.]|nr:M12 family metallo-peptidase [Candidatus Didemnitutus sp.]